jgi:hypothetical protein
MFLGIKFATEDEPRDMGGAKELTRHDRYQFQWWTLSLIGVRSAGCTVTKPREGKKGADEGVE